LEVINTFAEVTGSKVIYKIGPRRPGDIMQIWADTKKVNSILGWRTAYSLKESLRDAWNWQQRLADNSN
jgi:UDP-glucose 4-epimerase